MVNCSLIRTIQGFLTETGVWEGDGLIISEPSQLNENTRMAPCASVLTQPPGVRTPDTSGLSLRVCTWAISWASKRKKKKKLKVGVLVRASKNIKNLTLVQPIFVHGLHSRLYIWLSCWWILIIHLVGVAVFLGYPSRRRKPTKYEEWHSQRLNSGQPVSNPLLSWASLFREK